MQKLVMLVTLLGCVPPQQPQPSYYTQPQPQQGYYSQPGYGPAQPQQPPQEPGYQDPQTPPAYDPNYPQQPQQPPTQTRRFSFNGRAATAEDMQTLAQIERMYGKPAPEGAYWYDARSGAAGAWGGPTLGFLPAGLSLGGPLPAHASGGGNGQLTGVFVNGRELHPVDIKVLYSIYGQVVPGRWWVDGQGNAGQEGGPALINLVQIAQQRAASGRGRGAESYYRSDGRGNNAFVGGGCVSSSQTRGSGDDKKTYDYYGPGC
ncbi:MAG: hypothetical protein H0V17_21135 [Deltaproteobacteria bacterium]|nr:hypothetical protein [Deltaproteobacteria bacterium]